MTLHLVRHAVALRRADWEGSERLRPLSGGGHRQARRLAEWLESSPIERIVSSPHLRCRQTVEPLAARRGARLEVDERLAEGAGPGAALALLAELGDRHALLCTHGDLVSSLVARLCGAILEAGDEPRSAKGSVWVLEGPATAPSAASYRPPPSRSRRGEPPATRPAPETSELDPPEAGGDKLRVAVLDLGSTSFHLLVADAGPTGEIRRVLREREQLRLGAAIASGRGIPEKVCRHAVETARALRLHADHADAERLLVVATAALREAGNGPELAARIGDALEVPVRILSGEQEARLIFAAVRHRVAIPSGMHLALDLGGGSLELALGDAYDVCWESTLPLGVARLHGELVRSDPMSVKHERAVRERVRELLAGRVREVKRHAPGLCVATGGTVNALARLVATRRSRWPTRKVGQLFVPRAELRDLAGELAATGHRERLATPGLSRARADLLPTGAVILDAAVERLSLDGLTVSDWGLREGAILEALGLARADVSARFRRGAA